MLVMLQSLGGPSVPVGEQVEGSPVKMCTLYKRWQNKLIHVAAWSYWTI